jgi:hypothetical protein
MSRFGSMLLACAAALAVLCGCAGGPRAVGQERPRAQEVSKAMPFEQLQKNILADVRGASVQRQGNASRWLPLTAQDAMTPASTAQTVEAQFQKWCGLKSGQWFTGDGRTNFPEVVQHAMNDSQTLVNEGGMEYSSSQTRACFVDEVVYVVESARGTAVPRPDTNPGDGFNGYKFAWFSPKELASAKLARAGAERRLARLKEEQGQRQAAEAATRSEREEKNRREEVARTNLLTKSPKGTAIACQAYVLANGMSAPITRAPMDCSGFRLNMSDLVSNGWTLAVQTGHPDGDFGGTARTRFDMMWRKN